MDITLGKADIDKCWTFSKECAKHERPIEYGQEGAHVRDEDEIAQDTFIGKLGEVAVQQLLTAKGIATELDFRTMERGQWDHNDIIYNEWQIDIKCTKYRSKHFLIELNKLQFRADTGELPHFFIMTRLLKKPEVILNDGTCRIEAVGYIDTRHLNEKNPKVTLLQRGECIPNTRTEMTTESFCVSFADMEKDWNKFAYYMQNKKPFSFSNYRIPGFIYAPPVTLTPSRKRSINYSILLAGTAISKYTLKDIEQYIRQGIKCILFVPKSAADTWISLQNAYNMQHFELYIVYDDEVPSLEIYDGHLVTKREEVIKKGMGMKSSLEKLSTLSLSKPFNFEQYCIEHADTSNMMIVKAGAGTGKTTVMINRIMFLLATRKTKLKDIGMITFTNHAATVMTQRLQKNILEMYELTLDFYWKECLEEVGDMQISTIDSFFNSIVKNEGSVLGYGSQISIKSFIYEKKRILKEIIDEHFQKNPVPNLLKYYGMPIHEYVNHAFNLWEKLNSRGYFQDDIYNMDFGEGATPESKIINTNLKLFISEAERRYQTFKKKKNAYAVSDIKADMHSLSLDEMTTFKRTDFKFLFIDEFQDTDNSQIQSIAWLQKLLNCQLFVVGDIKQSIYRFRGAKETAFDELKKQLIMNGLSDEQIKDYSLTKNYRTSKEVIAPLNHIFEAWGKKDLLDWQKPAVTCINTPGHFENIVFSKYTKKTKLNCRMIDIIKKWMDVSHVCVLTRSNSKVKQFAELCRENNITCIAKLEGGFYQSEPVRDFSALLAALLYPKDNRCLYNLLISPYTSSVPDSVKLEKMNGNTKQINDYLNFLLERDGWHGYWDKLRYEPVFTIIENILNTQNPLERYRTFRENAFPLYGNNSDPAIDVQSYELNLNKLMKILYEKFTGEYVTILKIYDFLQNKMQTNTDEDILYPEPKDKKSYVECMTVHKAKGDEFETVILPYTRGSFFKDELDDKKEGLITINKTNPPRAAWAFNYNGKPVYNKWYETYIGEENDAVRREEARILYVALTRAKQNLLCLITDEPEQDTWDSLLQNQEE